ncbi:MAG: insulinase family protein [Chlamydiia bacterium]|nr:insulinase family protein [Chlamydiia bacterium]
MTRSTQHPFSAGKLYRDFRITKSLPLAELQSTLIELVHEPTGARVIHIAADDPENLFCLSFQTRPCSSNGVAHILEHTVLCGSKRYPVKDPFFSMTRRSLNTFMNALTGSDFTCYPASSQVQQDFYNLLEVYLDAVFHPELKLLSFLQEGHRFEFAEPQNPQSSLQWQGVVYNEMKGNLSSSESRLWRAVFKYLLPDLPYAYNTGGDPKDIPNLAYEDLIEFHRDFYHPSRCLFFFYGNIPLSQHLDFIASKALTGAGKCAPLPPLPLQPRFSTPISVSEAYPVSATEPLDKKTLCAFAWLTAPVTQQGEILALSLLDTLLMNDDASPLRAALLKSGLCTQASSSLDVEMSEVPWLLVCRGCEKEGAEPLKNLLLNTLRTIAASPPPADQIEAALHQLEFQRIEISDDEGPFGLTLFMRAALIAQHGCEPENSLLIHTLFKDLRAKLADPEYIPHLIRHHLIDNPHFLTLTLLPDPKLEQAEAAEERGRLDRIAHQMTEQTKKHILLQSEKLSAYQETTENQSLDCLPKLSLKDVPIKIRDFPLQQYPEGRLTTFHHSCFTNNVLYADLLFDLPYIPAADLPLASLFVRLLPEMGCGGKSYTETLRKVQAYTGGIGATLSLHVSEEDPNQCRPSLSLKGKALARNSKELLQLFSDLFSTPDFTDKERIQELLSKHATVLQSQLTRTALNYAIQTSLSGFSSASYVFNLWNGLPYYQAVRKWVEDIDLLTEGLQRIQKTILGVGAPHLVLSCDHPLFETLHRERFFGLAESLPDKPLTPWRGNYTLPKNSSQARCIPSPVAFTAWGTRTIAYRDSASPLLLLSTELMQNTILHKEIREKGGAYGAEASYTPSTGNYYLYSYRDPQLSKTLATFRTAIEKIAAGKFNERELEEAKLCVLQSLDAPITPGGRAIVAYSWQRAGRTREMRETFRNTILSARSDEVANALRAFVLPQEKILVSFLGEDLLEKEKDKIQPPLSILSLESP